MMLDIRLPELPGGAARVLRWLAAPGEALGYGAPLVIVLTERAEVLLPAPAAGALAEPAPVGTSVEPGAPICRLVPAAHPWPAADRRAPGARPLRATPLARRIALEHGLDL
ncbi:MAG: hypothetical protein HGA45_42785, partial [Chloroflexales bacterium]|nr:hypothetical protein [Chloroflexales bacterium]